ncbi:hypothetical protein GLAREA_01689 [Glarea lozoyensis ATCC 20868]|uniref:Uncharacterized protein n=1 Tax=Glarea lozoyensis (strain ATCC 20868 / MF5171) TaxID=1116229 RepID=S3CH57_GLAL2|nr:uncharacterized protein GLAREA_01689 [Glarea lozoyensis ATCC 20868]EPE25777.1 hypothetical protein GLAREA_01689 [Glarea lozoyensis ATCC 20868]
MAEGRGGGGDEMMVTRKMNESGLAVPGQEGKAAAAAAAHRPTRTGYDVCKQQVVEHSTSTWTIDRNEIGCPGVADCCWSTYDEWRHRMMLWMWMWMWMRRCDRRSGGPGPWVIGDVIVLQCPGSLTP